MSVEVVIPSPGESITEVTLGQWLCNDGDWVAQDDNLVEIESDKVTLEIPAPASGVLRIAAEAGKEMEVATLWPPSTPATALRGIKAPMLKRQILEILDQPVWLKPPPPPPLKKPRDPRAWPPRSRRMPESM